MERDMNFFRRRIECCGSVEWLGRNVDCGWGDMR